MVFPNLFTRDSHMDTAAVQQPSVMPIAGLHDGMKQAHDSLIARLKTVRSEQARLAQLEFELTTSINAIAAGAKVLNEAIRVETTTEISEADLG